MSGAPNAPKLRLLQIVTGLGVGGAERVVLELTSGLERLGHDVTVVSLSGDRDLLLQYPERAQETVVLDVKKRSPLSVVMGLVETIRLARRARVDAIHAHMFHGLVAGLLCKAFRPGAKLVFTSHSFGGFRGLRGWLIRVTQRFRDADVIFCEGQHETLNACVTCVIPNGVRTAAAGALGALGHRRRPVFLFAGRLEPLKNPLAAVEALGRMRHHGCELWVAGEGSLKDELKSRSSAADVSGRVKLLGLRDDLPRVMCEVDCFVMASRWEGMPMVILEAGAAGLPVIAPAVGAIPSVLGDECGYLASPDDLPQAMDAVLDDPAEAHRRAERLRRRIGERYSVGAMVAAHERLYARTVGRLATADEAGPRHA